MPKWPTKKEYLIQFIEAKFNNNKNKKQQQKEKKINEIMV